MAARNSIMGKLNSKKVELEKNATAALDQSAYHEQQAEYFKGSADLSLKQKSAVDEAFSILSKAGVDF
jgi:hypothetical protein